MNTPRWPAVAVMLGISFLAFSCQSTQTAVPPKAAPAPAARAAVMPDSDNIFSGTIIRIRPSAHLLTVKSSSGQKDFVVRRKTKVFTETSRHAALSTLNYGDLVNVHYEQNETVATATLIVRTAVAAGGKPATDVERLERMLNPDPSNPFKLD